MVKFKTHDLDLPNCYLVISNFLLSNFLMLNKKQKLKLCKPFLNQFLTFNDLQL